MSTGPLGFVAGSAAGSPLAQTKGSEVERNQQDAAAQQRRAAGDQKADSAAGVGQPDGEDHETNERDADGRRLWESSPEDRRAEKDAPSPGKNARGESGSLLDLTG